MDKHLAHLTNPDTPIAIIGLGYVGLPLAVEFAKHRPVIGFDINQARIAELQSGRDGTLEVTPEDLAAARHLSCTSDLDALSPCRIFIVTVPTPVDDYKRPDLTPLIKASETVGKVLKPGDLVIYESTVYPGCTEEDCVPVLARASGLTYIYTDRRTAAPATPPNPDRRASGVGRMEDSVARPSAGVLHEGSMPSDYKGFYCGYSPERINPGDREHRLVTIKKVTSGSTPEIAAIVDALYREIIVAGTHPASSIRVAEAAKVIENTQRDLNIALMNELSLIFDKLGIDTLEVLEAAGSKWNFLPFRPGLVGGHCIGVDPYYLTHKAVAIGYHPEVILAGRRINDRMGAHVAETVVKLMLQNGIGVCNSRILVLGFAFKENCPDLRNTRVIDIVLALREYNIAVDCYDPWIDTAEAKHEYGLACLPEAPAPGTYDAVILAVAHRDFIETGATGIRQWAKRKSILYDVKSVLPVDAVDGRL
ncbi:nucleotide sugar dehydrogenase [Thiocapsa marina]|uniref:Nucleotide sugar dehydrogenase n=1 Tax=Thiocapsa marina 5811 TaxID=768671 RepID=F9UBU3_9GAMM|nr:nucleotide sugar dehydrogenase [Thiocapsa marina]EGV18411.1 nucleotide sugar dehydrogenase [Thiocapsa marina 5811]